jgi:NADPH:quinone reductase-like Zn-dependent oxidoreductase
MKAMVCSAYGPPDVLRMEEVEKPVPRDNEVLIRVCATTVTSADCRVRALNMPLGFKGLARLALGFSKPRQPILGVEVAGEIESVGSKVKKLKVGERVFAICGGSMGAYAEYKCIPENGALVSIPSTLRCDEVVSLSFGGTTALDFFRRAKLQPGEKVLVNGASGGVGTAAVQLAKHLGAEVTGVCSADNLELVKSPGADHVIDYTREDFTKNGKTYDLIVDTAGTAPFSRSRESLKDGGRHLSVAATLPDMLVIPWVALSSNKRIIAGPASERAEDLRLLARLAQVGRFVPVIDRCYRFEQLAEAHRYVDAGHKRGNVLICLK